ncbi:MAG: preprotein translocase subunit YajC [Planctomycetes bacterium]|nr:preprotein translocase subunit YajC [Planctomycetota bacterium]
MFRMLAEGAPQGGSILSLIIPVGLIFVLMYFMIIRPQRRQEQKRREMIAAITKNDRVLTAGGIIGVVTNLKDDELTLRIDDARDVKVRVTRTAVTMVLEREDKKEAGD